MIVGIMQPYFAPYLGYFDLIRQSDRWVVFDSVQYIRHGWVNRNRVLHPTKGWQYVIVPLKKHRRDTMIRDIQPSSGTNWGVQIIHQLHHYHRAAPYYTAVVDLLQSIFSRDYSSIVHLNVTLLHAICQRLGLPFRYDVFSAMTLGLPAINAPGDWALEIATALRADGYINPPGGRELFNPAAFRARGIELMIQTPVSFTYETPGYTHVPDLSIIDVMMWNSPEEIRAHLEKGAAPLNPTPGL